jgi:hypothetical protein
VDQTKGLFASRSSYLPSRQSRHRFTCFTRLRARQQSHNVAGLFASVEDTGLIRRAVGAPHSKLDPCGRASFAALHELQIPGRRNCVALAKLVACYVPTFRHQSGNFVRIHSPVRLFPYNCRDENPHFPGISMGDCSCRSSDKEPLVGQLHCFGHE